MPRPPRPWFRWYVEAFSDQKLRRLTPTQRWIFAALCGIARQSPTPGLLLVAEAEPMTETEIADFAAVNVRELRKALPALERMGMIARDQTTTAWRVVNFRRRQFESDVSTDRTRKHRSKEPERNVPTAVPGTPKERPSERSPSRARVTESETDTDPSSSVGSLRPPDQADDDDPDIPADPTTETALAILAQRDLDTRQQNSQLEPIGDTTSWLTRATNQRRVRHAHRLAELRSLDPDATPHQLAEAVDPPGQTTPGTPLDGQQEAMLAAAHEGMDHMRAIVHEPPPSDDEQAKVRSIIAGVKDRVQRPGAQEAQ